MGLESPELAPVPPPGACRFYFPKKKRFCRGPPGESGLCTLHAPPGEKVSCPFEPGVFILPRDLQRHLAICPNRPLPPPLYFAKGVNRRPGESEPAKGVQNANARALDAMSVEQFLSFADKIDRLYTLKVLEGGTRADLRTATLEVEKLEALVPTSTIHLGKHSRQISSLVAHLCLLGMDPSWTLVEFGCGRAELSQFVNGALSGPSRFVLVDRENPRNKYDAPIRNARHPGHDAGSETNRLIIDIADLDLAKVAPIAEDLSRPLLAYSKHLCGPATDLTLRCLSSFASQGGNVAGIAIALCCHQRCTADSLAGAEFLVGDHADMLTEEEFRAACVVSTWTLSWYGEERQRLPKDTNGDSTEQDGTATPPENSSATHWSGLPRDALEKLGFQVKRLLDWARCRYLDSVGLEAELAYYVQKDVTPENVVLLATPRKN
ncbi:methyltransferase TRM13-domain-containing protein [Hyaloraphidium curvatum]|nr:methyltransferase TRM13-domain-containing protein [Hyaloraphidium curvatum]